MFEKILLLIVPILLSACTQASLAVVNLPARFDDSEVVSDIAYGTDVTQKLDIYIPVHTAGKAMDVIVFLYGGRWSSGRKEDYSFVGVALADQGFITVIPDYRKYPTVRFPVFVDDSAKALVWAYDHISAYDGRPGHIFVVGHSAGAHIGALLATDAHYLAVEGKKTTDVIHGFLGLAGPYSFTPDEPDLEDMFGPPENYSAMRATSFVDGHQPPMLLLWGQDDSVVKRINLDKLEQSVHEKGGEVRSILYPDTGHIDILGDLTWLGNSTAPVRRDIVSYINEIDAREAINPLSSAH